MFLSRCYYKSSQQRDILKNKLKMAEKGVSTSFWVRTVPKSWSKYTTRRIAALTKDYNIFPKNGNLIFK